MSSPKLTPIDVSSATGSDHLAQRLTPRPPVEPQREGVVEPQDEGVIRILEQSTQSSIPELIVAAPTPKRADKKAVETAAEEEQRKLEEWRSTRLNVHVDQSLCNRMKDVVLKFGLYMIGAGLMFCGIWLSTDKRTAEKYAMPANWCLWLGIVLISELAVWAIFTGLLHLSLKMGLIDANALYYASGIRRQLTTLMVTLVMVVSWGAIFDATDSNSKQWTNLVFWVERLLYVVLLFAAARLCSRLITLNLTVGYQSGSVTQLVKHILREHGLHALAKSHAGYDSNQALMLSLNDALSKDAKTAVAFWDYIVNSPTILLRCSAPFGAFILRDGANIQRATAAVRASLEVYASAEDENDAKWFSKEDVANVVVKQYPRSSAKYVVEALWIWFTHGSNTDRVAWTDLEDRINDLRVERLNLIEVAKSTSQVVDSFEQVVSVAMNLIAGLIAVGILGLDVSNLWISISSLLLSFSFVFSNSMRELYESCIFVFSQRAFRIGDKVRLVDGDTYHVRKMNLLTTQFLRWDGSHIVRRNSQLMGEVIQNFALCNTFSMGLWVTIDAFSCTPRFLSVLTAEMNALSQQRPDLFVENSCGITVREIEDGLHTKLKIGIDNSFIEDAAKINQCKTLMFHVFREHASSLGVSYSGLSPGVAQPSEPLSLARPRPEGP